ncbi:MAG: stage V sporulation protein AD [Oscillospiraceae bacterium]
MNEKKGDTIIFENAPSVISFAAIGGKKESEGPLADKFDLLVTDTRCGQKSWEGAESIFARHCIEQLLAKANCTLAQTDCVFSGDLQCQCTGSSYAMRSFDLPHIGLYSACATMAQGMALAACMISGGMMSRVIAMTSSHFCAAERQFRTPLDYGGKRTPSSQWTVTAAGGAMLANCGEAPYVRAVTFGRVQDYDITDINNMGAAMAPAAAATILQYFKDTKESPDSFDKIYTGDLGAVGSALLLQILKAEGISIKSHEDCGLLVYDREIQNVGAGGSGAGCSAAVLACHVLPALKRGTLKRVLFVSTGALMSQTTFLQGESIPCVAHLIELSHK